MANFEKIFEKHYDSINNATAKEVAKSESINTKDYSIANESSGSLPAGPQEEFTLQTQIRPIFGKDGVNNSPIGTHPDFIALEGTGTTQKHYTCTLFVDIKGSTRLSLLYPLEFVFKFKNAVIQTCVEIIRSLDGHVHRLMGDAVMAFFGGSHTEKEDAVADAINCSITLRAVLEESIKPWMERQGLDSKDFGFRVGCDFGNDDEVLWGSFGYQDVGEVSATGLPVDMASKLQSLAGKNQTMLGQGILDFVDWPEKYSNIKTKNRNGATEEINFVTPNITNRDGSPLDYVMRQLSYAKCLEFCALPRMIREHIDGCDVKDNPHLEFKCYTVSDEERTKYISASMFLEPNLSLVFEVVAGTVNRLKFPLRVVFKKTNHGSATPEAERDIEQIGKVKFIHKKRKSTYNPSISPFSRVEIDETTLYRGLHTMKCEVFDNDSILLFRDWIGVMIK